MRFRLEPETSITNGGFRQAAISHQEGLIILLGNCCLGQQLFVNCFFSGYASLRRIEGQYESLVPRDGGGAALRMFSQALICRCASPLMACSRGRYKGVRVL